MTPTDEHLYVLRKMLAEQNALSTLGTVYPAMALIAEKKANALRWILEQNAYGVTEGEVVG